MPVQSFETLRTPFAIADGPLLEYAPQETETASAHLRIRARRVFLVSRNELFAAWTTRAGWESWLRLRARSRAVVTASPGGGFRLELAEGPTIHVITGTSREIRVDEFVSFTWMHHDTNDYGSIVEITFAHRCDQAELRLLHHSIASRREAAWLMRLWAAALDHLDRYFAASGVVARRASSAA